MLYHIIIAILFTTIVGVTVSPSSHAAANIALTSDIQREPKAQTSQAGTYFCKISVTMRKFSAEI